MRRRRERGRNLQLVLDDLVVLGRLALLVAGLEAEGGGEDTVVGGLGVVVHRLLATWDVVEKEEKEGEKAEKEAVPCAPTEAPMRSSSRRNSTLICESPCLAASAQT